MTVSPTAQAERVELISLSALAVAEWKEVIIDPLVELKRGYPHLLGLLPQPPQPPADGASDAAAEWAVLDSSSADASGVSP